MTRKLNPKDNGKRGHAFETKIAQAFSMWWVGDTKSLYRTSGSGSRKSQAMYGGDIAPCSDKATPWPFCIETKKVQKWSLENFVLGNPGEPLIQFMCQCLYAASQAENNIPLLVCAKNHKAPLLFLSVPQHPSVIGNLQKTGVYAHLHLPYAHIPKNLLLHYNIACGLDFVVLPLTTFFAVYSRKHFSSRVFA